MENWAKKVLYLMRQKNINQKQLAKKAGLTESTVSRYLHSKRTPDMKTFMKVCLALDVDVNYFLDEEDKNETAFVHIATAISIYKDDLTSQEKNKLILQLLS